MPRNARKVKITGSKRPEVPKSGREKVEFLVDSRAEKCACVSVEAFLVSSALWTRERESERGTERERRADFRITINERTLPGDTILHGKPHRSCCRTQNETTTTTTSWSSAEVSLN